MTEKLENILKKQNKNDLIVDKVCTICDKYNSFDFAIKCMRRFDNKFINQHYDILKEKGIEEFDKKYCEVLPRYLTLNYKKLR